MTPGKLGRYDLVRVLGHGAMGRVYEGHDPNLDRRVAIKTIQVENLSKAASAEYEFRFRTEARSAARLQHPNIVSMYDSDRDGGIAFLVMEFIPGHDLKHHLDAGVVYSLDQSVAILLDVLSALDYAHQCNVIHRDVKPANLLMQANGRVKLTDFGVARLLDTADLTLTQGAIVGTLKYMSPEQVQGLVIDTRADLFAAGVILYQLLAGHRPFDGGSDFAIIHEIIDHEPAQPSIFNPCVSPELDAVVMRAIMKSPNDRFATARDFAAALQAAACPPTAIDTRNGLVFERTEENIEVLHDFSATPVHALTLTQEGRGSKRWIPLIFVAVALLVVVVIGLGWMLWPAASAVADPLAVSVPPVPVVPAAAVTLQTESSPETARFRTPTTSLHSSTILRPAVVSALKPSAIAIDPAHLSGTANKPKSVGSKVTDTPKGWPLAPQPAPQQDPAPIPAPAAPLPSLKEACEGRFLLGHYQCMREQCVNSIYYANPLCVDLREKEEWRKAANIQER